MRWYPSKTNRLRDVLVHPRDYSRTSVARTLMARFPRLFRTCSWVPRKISKLHIWDNLVWYFFLILKMVFYVYSLKSPWWDRSNENTQHTLILKGIEKISLLCTPLSDLALWFNVISSNNACLEHIFMVTKVIEPWKLCCNRYLSWVCGVVRKKYITRDPVRHHEACRRIWRIFPSVLHTHYIYVFLHALCFFLGRTCQYAWF